MPHPRMCPDFYDGAVAAALIEAEEAGIGSDSSTSGSVGPVDLTSAYCSPFRHVWPRGLIPGAATSPAGISRRDSYAAAVHAQADSGTLVDPNAAWRKPLASQKHGTKFSGMPRVVENQRDKFENDPLLRRLNREVEVRYAGVPFERPIEQRRQAFERDVERGSLLVSVVSSGIHFVLAFHTTRDVPEAGSSHDMQRDLSLAEIRNNQLLLRARMILNGVCVIWTGHIDMQTLDGLGRIEFDTATAETESLRLPRAL
ncbi:core-binding factor subunit beta-like [Paramacrobiotus metropolitanus]|uniref:core-binding factor subunit beta-like n=1 Tax=Paramacrobiotus metropolitanus TaxID=2943436 RepID=UPI002445E2FC|nr:core-binding factor subunit beta-like [Paramacrobiotus metropolitanus]XP_055328929.1 core-binding factor subunit beta-like [Paramacrobiotus metropolitanus]XP_055328930.1 core-binding factor subunit beta-like [Paramacrobiotus metropolitanus]